MDVTHKFVKKIITLPFLQSHTIDVHQDRSPIAARGRMCELITYVCLRWMEHPVFVPTVGHCTSQSISAMIGLGSFGTVPKFGLVFLGVLLPTRSWLCVQYTCWFQRQFIGKSLLTIVLLFNYYFIVETFNYPNIMPMIKLIIYYK